MEKKDGYGKDGQLWRRRALMEKTGTYMEKTDTYGKAKTDTKHLKPFF